MRIAIHTNEHKLDALENNTIYRLSDGIND